MTTNGEISGTLLSIIITSLLTLLVIASVRMTYKIINEWDYDPVLGATKGLYPL